MKAILNKDGTVTTLKLIGYLDFESTAQLHQTCMEQLLSERLILDIHGLSFVGSSGISSFIETLREFFSKAPSHIKLCGVSPEFRRFFVANGLTHLEVYDSERLAVEAYNSGVNRPLISQLNSVWVSDLGAEDSAGGSEKVAEVAPLTHQFAGE